MPEEEVVEAVVTGAPAGEAGSEQAAVVEGAEVVEQVTTPVDVLESLFDQDNPPDFVDALYAKLEIEG